MRNLAIVSLLGATLMASGCASNSAKYAKSIDQAAQDRSAAVQTNIDSMPEWYTKPPVATDKVVYVVGTGTSKSLSMTKNKALLDAQRQLADQINSIVSGTADQYSKDAGVNGTSLYEETTTLTNKLINEANVAGYTVTESAVSKENDSYRMYVLLAYPLGKNNTLRSMLENEVMRKQAIIEKAQKQADLQRRIKDQRAKQVEEVTGAPQKLLANDTTNTAQN